jgi:predicted metal-dependent phosphoesterase TrpH
VSIDLHTHSTASDGTDSPAELVRTAWAAGVTVLGLTDHDTTGGWKAAADSLPEGMTLVPGAELSCEYQPPTGNVIPLHLLAYLFDPAEPGLLAEMDSICVDRINRAERMVALMEADGLPVTWRDVEVIAGGGTVGRPHIARALVDAGVVPSVDAAFAGPISSRSRYYVGKADIPVLDAIRLVRAAGGVCVFGHPMRRGRQVGDAGIAAMAAAGLRGIEVDHPDHDEAARLHLGNVAKELDLVALGSSDYHGSNKRTLIAACTTRPDQFEELVDPVRQRLVDG